MLGTLGARRLGFPGRYTRQYAPPDAYVGNGIDHTALRETVLSQLVDDPRATVAMPPMSAMIPTP